MNERGQRPGPEAREKGNGEGEMPSETKENHKVEDDAGNDPPKRAFREGLHDMGVAFVLHIYPDEDQGAGKGHDGDQTPGGRELSGDAYRREDN